MLLLGENLKCSGRDDTVTRIAIDIALFSVFALHHSLFARTPLRDWVSRVASPQLERSIYVWVASLMLILVCALWRPIPGVAWEVSGPGAWALRAATMAGLLLTLRSAVMIDVWELAGVRPARVPARRSWPACCFLCLWRPIVRRR